MTTVTDVERYKLALQAGFTGENAVTATALSIAENGAGDPALPSGANNNGSIDLGLWQINSAWWPAYGGKQALTDPLINAKAAFDIWQNHGGFNNWCTYWPTGCNSANQWNPQVQANWIAAMARARAATNGVDIGSITSGVGSAIDTAAGAINAGGIAGQNAGAAVQGAIESGHSPGDVITSAITNSFGQGIAQILNAFTSRIHFAPVIMIVLSIMLVGAGILLWKGDTIVNVGTALL